jgi:hypothetical protein
MFPPAESKRALPMSPRSLIHADTISKIDSTNLINQTIFKKATEIKEKLIKTKPLKKGYNTSGH